MVDQTENKNILQQAEEHNFAKVIVLGLNPNGAMELLTDLDTTPQVIYTINRAIFALQLNEERMISEALKQQQEGVVEEGVATEVKEGSE